MKFSVPRMGLALLAVCAAMLAGCLPSGQGQLDDEKEPHFLAGKSRGNALDYKGAVESFEKALEVNPRSALAHFELGVLFDQREGDPAAAIYHYERYLKLLPGAGNADTVKTRILACKQELARTVSLGPVTQTLQTEFEKLTEQNKRAAEEIKRLTDENGRLREEVDKWRAFFAARPLPQTNLPAAGTAPRPAPVPAVTATNLGSAAGAAVGVAKPASPPSPIRPSAASPGSVTRTHVVKSGETLGLIARQYGVRIESLLAANPGVDARRLRPGRQLKIPSGGK